MGTGADGRRRPDPGAVRQLQERGVPVEALPTGQAVRRYAELAAGHPAGMLGRGMALKLPRPDDHTPQPSIGQPSSVTAPRSVVGKELAGWPVGWPGSGRTQHREQGGRVYLHLGARHESPQRQPADGVAEVDPDQEAACGASASPFQNGKIDTALELAGPAPS